MNPEIEIKAGMTIGYQPRRLHGQNDGVRLASAANSITLRSGRHLLLARNGRGKTTLLKTLAGLLPVYEGDYSVAGQRQFVDEELRFDRELNPKQIFKAFLKNGALETALQLADQVELELKKVYGKLSKGNRQKVSLILAEARASEGGPQILLLDEPFSGLDFHVRDVIDDWWNRHTKHVLRLVCVHPDEPTLQAESALVINEGEIAQVEVDGALDWFETRKSLN